MAGTMRDAPAYFRKYGLRVELAPAWTTHDNGPLGQIQTIVAHHTAGARTGRYPSYGVVRNGRAGLPGPLAQVGLARDGSVILFSAGLSYHAGAVRNGSMDNYNAIGIEAESTGYGDWTPEQVSAYPRVCAALADLFDLPASRVMAHAEICSPPGRKIDAAKFPGGMNGMRATVARLLRDGGSAPKEDDMDFNSKYKDKWGNEQSLGGKLDILDQRAIDNERKIDQLADAVAKLAALCQQQLVANPDWKWNATVTNAVNSANAAAQSIAKKLGT